MVHMKDLKFKSHKTAISRKTASAPLRYLLEKQLIPAECRVLDYGCGRGKDVGWLNSSGVRAFGYDPYQEGWDNKAYLQPKYDIITCTYVLNVVDKYERELIIESIRKSLKPGGKAYISVRRDIKTPTKTKIGTHQWPVYLPYKIIKENSSFCIYEINNETRSIFRQTA